MSALKFSIWIPFKDIQKSTTNKIIVAYSYIHANVLIYPEKRCMPVQMRTSSFFDVS